MSPLKMNHICFSVSDLDRSIAFYREVFEAKLLVKGRRLAYLDLDGLWFALNQEDIERPDLPNSYTHMAFSMEEKEYDQLLERLERAQARVLPGRERVPRDRQSIYFLDPDGHMFEFHAGTLAERLDYYRAAKPHMQFFEEQLEN